MIPKGVNLRRAGVEDIAAIKDIADRCLREEYSSDLLKFLMDNHGQCFFVAEDDERLIGFVLGVPLDNKTLRILMIAVDGRERKKGIGSALMDACNGYAKQRMMTAMILEVGTRNAEAIDFYTQRGFKVTGMIPRYYRDRSDAFVMKRYFLM